MTADHDEQRDPQLSALLRATVDAPPLRPGFHDELESRLAAADDAARGAHVTSIPARRRRLTARRMLAAAAVAAVAAAVIAIVVLPAVQGPDTATAADMLASMDGMAGVQTVHLRLVGTSRYDAKGGPHYKEWVKEDLTLSVTGDFRGTSRGNPDGADRVVTRDFGYDAERHQLRVFSAGDGVMALHPAWPIPLPESESDYLRYEATAASVRAMLAELDPATPVEETTFLARPAWRASLPSVWNGSPELTVIVDKETGLLMETRRSGTVKAGSYLDVLRITRFEPDPPLDAGWQTVPLLTKPSGTDDWNSFRDIGTRFGGTKSVAERAWPTLPLLPQWAPEGYRLSAMANAVYEDMRPGHDDENSWHWKAKIVRRPGRLPGLAISKRLALKRCAQGVLVLYRRGFGTFTVEVSPRIPGEPGMGTLPRESRQTMQETVLSGGYLKGARARTWISSALLPVAHVWGDSMYVKEQGPTLLTYSDRSQVVIYGDLTRQELIDVANSLQVHGDVEKPLPAGYGD